MTPFLLYIARGGLYLSLFYAFYLLVMRRTTFFRMNRVMLLAGSYLCMLPSFTGSDRFPADPIILLVESSGVDYPASNTVKSFPSPATIPLFSSLDDLNGPTIQPKIQGANHYPESGIWWPLFLPYWPKDLYLWNKP